MVVVPDRKRPYERMDIPHPHSQHTPSYMGSTVQQQCPHSTTHLTDGRRALLKNSIRRSSLLLVEIAPFTGWRVAARFAFFFWRLSLESPSCLGDCPFSLDGDSGLQPIRLLCVAYREGADWTGLT